MLQNAHIYTQVKLYKIYPLIVSNTSEAKAKYALSSTAFLYLQ